MPEIIWLPIEGAPALPRHNERCLITDGKDIAIAAADMRTYKDGRIWWNGSGFFGYEWEWDFKPTHWASAEDIPLPPKAKE